MTKRKHLHRKHLYLGIFIALTLLVAVLGIAVLNLRPSIDEPTRVYVPSGSTYETVLDTLQTHNCIPSMTLFKILAKVRGYDQSVKSGSYVITPTMNSIGIVQKLYRGAQDPVSITISRHRTKESLSKYLADHLEMSADEMMAELTSDTALTDFTQNTFEVYWNTSPQRFHERMRRETRLFWNEDRMAKCADLGMTPTQVTILASIVEEETNNNEEKPNIASVYLNRLRKGMLLQADPTLKYAVGDFTIRRLTAKHIAADSPYNTYKNKGLPPGPICIPSHASIDAVLANKTTAYLYFCAKEDFSGRHNFAATLAEHNRNAARFHKALNERNIK